MPVDARIPFAEERLIALANRLSQVLHRVFQLLINLLIILGCWGLWRLRLGDGPDAVLLPEVAPASGS